MTDIPDSIVLKRHRDLEGRMHDVWIRRALFALIAVIPILGLLNVFKVFYPKSYFWFSVTAPHTWVRYQGLENGPGSPEIVIEPR